MALFSYYLVYTFDNYLTNILSLLSIIEFTGKTRKSMFVNMEKKKKFFVVATIMFFSIRESREEEKEFFFNRKLLVDCLVSHATLFIYTKDN
jgi:hypothetical protein